MGEDVGGDGVSLEVEAVRGASFVGDLGVESTDVRGGVGVGRGGSAR